MSPPAGLLTRWPLRTRPEPGGAPCADAPADGPQGGGGSSHVTLADGVPAAAGRCSSCAAIGFAALLIPTLVAAAPTSVAPLPAAGLQKATRVPVAGGGGWTAQSVLRKPFAPTSPWNTPIPPGARFTPTATFAGDPGWMTSEKNSNPVYVAKPTDPILTFNVVRPNITRVFQMRGPADLTPAASKDLNLTIVDLGANHVWDFFRVVRTGPTTFQAEAFGDTDLDGTGFGSFPPGGGARVRAGVKASGASWLGGLVTGENLATGGIDHTLAIHVGNDDLYPAFVPPAVEFDGDGASTYRGTLPMGTRLGHPSGHARAARSLAPRRHDLRRPQHLRRLRARPQRRLQPRGRRPDGARVGPRAGAPALAAGGIGSLEDRAAAADRRLASLIATTPIASSNA